MFTYGGKFETLLRNMLDALMLDFDATEVVESVSKVMDTDKKNDASKEKQKGGGPFPGEEGSGTSEFESACSSDSSDDGEGWIEDLDCVFPGLTAHVRGIQVRESFARELAGGKQTDEQVGGGMIDGLKKGMEGMKGMKGMKEGMKGMKEGMKGMTGAKNLAKDHKRGMQGLVSDLKMMGKEVADGVESLKKSKAAAAVRKGVSKATRQLHHLASLYAAYCTIEYSTKHRSVIVKNPSGRALELFLTEARYMMRQRFPPSFLWDMKVKQTDKLRKGITAYFMDITATSAAMEAVQEQKRAAGMTEAEEESASEIAAAAAADTAVLMAKPPLMCATDFIRCAAAKTMERFVLWLTGKEVSEDLLKQFDELDSVTLAALAKVKSVEVMMKRRKGYENAQRLRKTCIKFIVPHMKSRAMMFYCQRLGARIERAVLATLGAKRGNALVGQLVNLQVAAGDKSVKAEILDGPIRDDAKTTIAYILATCPRVIQAFDKGDDLYNESNKTLSSMIVKAILEKAPPVEDVTEDSVLRAIDKAVESKMKEMQQEHDSVVKHVVKSLK